MTQKEDALNPDARSGFKIRQKELVSYLRFKITKAAAKPTTPAPTTMRSTGGIKKSNTMTALSPSW